MAQKDKISKRGLTNLSERLLEAKLERQEAQKDYDNALHEFMAALQLIVMDDCPVCKGIGEIEDGLDDMVHYPSGRMLYRKCRRCEGLGYLPNAGENEENSVEIQESERTI